MVILDVTYYCSFSMLYFYKAFLFICWKIFSYCYYFQVHKFSRHALSNCTYWQDAKNIDHINLEDILANADKEGVHVLLDDNEFVELEDDEFCQTQEDNYEHRDHDVESNENAYQMVDVADDSQFSEHQNEHANFVNHYVIHSENQYAHENHTKQKNVKGNFNLNLGEFSVDDVKTHHE